VQDDLGGAVEARLDAAGADAARGVARHARPEGAASLMLPVTVEPSSIAGGGSIMPTLTWNVLVAQSACGETSRTRPVARTDGSLVSAICTTGSCGHIEHSVASALTRDVHDHLSGVDHLARLGAGRGHHAGGIGEQDRIAQLILRDSYLGMSAIDLGLGAQKCLLGLVEFRARRPAVRQKLLLSTERQAGLRQRGHNRNGTVTR
jgi:hypothetical protein